MAVVVLVAAADDDDDDNDDMLDNDFRLCICLTGGGARKGEDSMTTVNMNRIGEKHFINIVTVCSGLNKNVI